MNNAKKKLEVVVGDTTIRFGSLKEKAKFLEAIVGACRRAAEIILEESLSGMVWRTEMERGAFKLVCGSARNTCNAFAVILANSMGMEKGSSAMRRQHWLNCELCDEIVAKHEAAKEEKND